MVCLFSPKQKLNNLHFLFIILIYCSSCYCFCFDALDVIVCSELSYGLLFKFSYQLIHDVQYGLERKVLLFFVYHRRHCAIDEFPRA